jgi:GTP-binding protein
VPQPVVALVGRTNVGKSTLFNRLAGARLAVVDQHPGTTRDRLVAEAEWNGVAFHIVDTGGVDPFASSDGDLTDEYAFAVRAQAEQAAEEADLILFVVDAEAGATASDHEIARLLRRRRIRGKSAARPPVLLVVNKADNAARRQRVVEFYALGLGEPIAVSALHGSGTGDLLDVVVTNLRRRPAPRAPEAAGARIAILGRPNVGKSSLLNRMLGEERVIVSPTPGTTRDAVDTHLRVDGTDVTLIDTAGIRRRGRIAPGVEKYSVLRALKALERAHVVLLTLDAADGVTAQDAHIAGLILARSKSTVAVVNKWDLLPRRGADRARYAEQLRGHLNFLDYVPVLCVSAKTGDGVPRVLPTALEVYAQRHMRVPTGPLNRLVSEAVDRHPPPGRGSRSLKIVYASQVRADPPTFLFHVNDPALVHFSYARYLENTLRARYGFLGTPLRLSFRARSRRRPAA